MYCLEKLQKELTSFLEIDINSLKSVPQTLYEKGYTHIQKGDENIDINALLKTAESSAQTTPPHHTNTTNTEKSLFDTDTQTQTTPPHKAESSLESTPQKVDSSTPKTKHEQREQTKTILAPLINKPITNQNDGRVAQISRKNIAKMISDKAVAKSVANGFSEAQHFSAVQEVDTLYQRAVFKETTDDKNGENYLKIHRYITETDTAQAKITLKESEEHGNKIYTLELEELQPPKIQVHSQDIGEQVSKSRKPEPMHPDTPLENADNIIPQDSNDTLQSAMKKFNYSEKKARDLLEWHKDSHPLTKDENGLPKVFYHGTEWGKFEIFNTKYSNQKDRFLRGHYFSSSKKIARTYNTKNIYETFLNAKNPLVIDFKGQTFNDYIDKAISDIPKSEQKKIGDFYDCIIFKNIIDDRRQNGKKHPVADTIMVFDSNQIKHIENKGIESEQGRKFFNENSPNIYQSSPHAGASLLGGSAAGIEQDENGNIIFSPEKFALGLLGGAGGSIGISKAVGKGAVSGKYAIMRRMEAKKHDKKLYSVFKAIDSSAKYGSKMNLIGKQNLNADTLAYALARNKRFAINKLDEKTAKELGFTYPHDVRRTIQPDEIIHTLTRHGENSDLVKFSGQKPVTLDEIAKYQDYADNAQAKQESRDKSNNRVLVSVKQFDNEFLVVIEQIRKGQNELSYKNMYFEKGIMSDETLARIFKRQSASQLPPKL